MYTEELLRVIDKERELDRIGGGRGMEHVPQRSDGHFGFRAELGFQRVGVGK